MKINTPENYDSEKRELTPEETENTLSALQTRFEANMFLHEGIKWSDVKASLEANHEAVRSLAQMEAAGHDPDVYYDDENDYYFGTCSKESPESAGNCTYYQAIKMAKTMSIKLMLPEHYKNILQKKGYFDDKGTWSWLLTHSDITRSAGRAFRGYRLNDLYYDVNEAWASDHDKLGGWRGSLKVKKVTA